MATLFLLLLALAAPGRAYERSDLVGVGTRTPTGYDELFFAGWGQGCSAGLRYFSYAPTGEVMEGLPVTWSVGSLTIVPGDPRPREDWIYKGITSKAWEKWRADDAAAQLRKRGYLVQGRSERVAPPQPGKPLGPEETLLLSTAAFQLADPVRWPTRNWRIDEVRYSPLGTCLFVVFRDTAAPTDTYRWRLVRVQNPGVRRVRARAHVTRGMRLYQQDADIYRALDELAAAAGMDPDYPVARYHHAVLLALHGRTDEAVAELKTAVSLDPAYRKKAEDAVEFVSLRRDRRFQDLLHPPKAAPKARKEDR
jgi:hypothetical protein